MQQKSQLTHIPKFGQFHDGHGILFYGKYSINYGVFRATVRVLIYMIAHIFYPYSHCKFIGVGMWDVVRGPWIDTNI